MISPHSKVFKTLAETFAATASQGFVQKRAQT